MCMHRCRLQAAYWLKRDSFYIPNPPCCRASRFTQTGMTGFPIAKIGKYRPKLATIRLTGRINTVFATTITLQCRPLQCKVNRMWAWAGQWQTGVIALLLLMLVWSAWLTWQQMRQLWRLLWQPFHVGKTYRCKVVNVDDGNRLWCRRRWRRRAVLMKLAYSTAPNLKQTHGTAAKLALSKAAKGKTLQIWTVGEDEYCLHIEAHVRGKSLCELLIAKGWARAATSYARDRDERDYLLNLQKKAQAQKLGLWKTTPTKSPTRKHTVDKKSANSERKSKTAPKAKATSKKTKSTVNASKKTAHWRDWLS